MRFLLGGIAGIVVAAGITEVVVYVFSMGDAAGFLTGMVLGSIGWLTGTYFVGD